MATTVESPIQYDRDLRGANKEWKRTKDSSAKWSCGSRPSGGVWTRGEHYVTGSESQQAKSRPRKRQSDNIHPKQAHNLVKPRMAGTWAKQPGLVGRMRTNFYAMGEINDASRSLSDMPPLTRRLSSASAGAENNVLYSFDRRDTPGRPLTLDIFVKAPTARDTERLVEKEYEVLDDHGELLTGRKARRHLRQAATDLGPTTARAGSEDTTIIEDEGFELV